MALLVDSSVEEEKPPAASGAVWQGKAGYCSTIGAALVQCSVVQGLVEGRRLLGAHRGANLGRQRHQVFIARGAFDLQVEPEAHQPEGSGQLGGDGIGVLVALLPAAAR